MKIQCVATGSKGNAFLVERKKDTILIDAGAKVEEHFDKILITHSHSDHISHIKSLSNKAKWFAPYHIAKDVENRTQAKIMGKYEMLKDKTIRAFMVNHDVSCAGYVIYDGDESYCHITDTIMFEPPGIAKNCTYYGIESNYDKAMIVNSVQPVFSTQRTIATGHLSNDNAADLLNELAGDKTKGVMWLHMSSDNNDEEIAKMTHEEKVKIGMVYGKKGAVLDAENVGKKEVAMMAKKGGV